MGTYLSTPVTEKHSEEGESLELAAAASPDSLRHVAWGVVDMQGWRKSMEDAHVAQTNVPCCVEDEEHTDSAEKPAMHVFGVFDGHGGAEVARFCALYIVSVLQQQILQSISSSASVNETMGAALKDTFHAMDRLIDDPGKTDELMKLRVLAPPPAEQRRVDSIPPPLFLPEILPAATSSPEKVEATTVPDSSPDKTLVEDDSTTSSEPPSSVESLVGTNEESTDAVDEDEEDADSLDNPEEGVEEACILDQDMSSDDEDEPVEEEETAQVEILPVSTPELPEDPALDSDVSSLDDDHAFMTSIHVAMHEAERTTVTSSSSSTVKNASSVSKMTGIFQRFLKFNGSSGQLVLQLGSSSSGKVAPTTVTGKATSTTILHKSETVVTMSPPSVVRNGQLMCNLSDHHIHAGATAIVAVMVGRTLTVANAGDSRAVLARGAYGVLALSLDHKPTQPTELQRIVQAGGFVNSFGRINGNLNLSRSIGDLKYKQVRHLPPAQQMISAEPDIVQLRI